VGEMRRYLGFTTVNVSDSRTRQSFVFILLAIALIFLCAGTITVIRAESNLRSSSLSKVTSHISTKSLVLVMGEDIPYLREYLHDPGIGRLAAELMFEMTTSIDFKDPRTFLGRELPLYALFDSEIVVASSDVDYTYIPIESPPPVELEKEIAKALKDAEKKESMVGVTDVSQGKIKEKRVLIYNTHHWESYFPELPKGKKDPSDVKVNVTQLSKYLLEQLEKREVGAQTTFDWYGWNNAYASSRRMVQAVMKQNDQLLYFVDIHRDSLPRNRTTLYIEGKSYARLSFIVGEASKNYEKNLQLAHDLDRKINKICPGLSKGVFTKKRNRTTNGEYNQSISPNSFLVEVGGEDNSFTEGYRSLDVLAKVLAEKVIDTTDVMKKSSK
jgi:stage II sporulation protein P